MEFQLNKELALFKDTVFCDSPSLCEEFVKFGNEALSFKREKLSGHFTASSFVYDPQQKKTLVLKHAKLNLWLQPGGHADGDENLLRVATRELEEEASLKLKALPGIFDLDRHFIPENKGVPEHYHWDVRFIFIADSQKVKPMISDESRDFKWIALEEFTELQIDDSIHRMMLKALNNFK